MKSLANTELASCFDARIWAKEFCKINTASDEGTMLGWFANAIMAGYDHAKKVGLSRPYISQIENAERTPRVDTFEKILNACGYTLSMEKLNEVSK